LTGGRGAQPPSNAEATVASLQLFKGTLEGTGIEFRQADWYPAGRSGSR
jgi:hypothetical protein